MEKLLKSADVAHRMNVTSTTARGYMRQMSHIENPLRVDPRVFEEWLQRRSVTPGATRKPTTTVAKRAGKLPYRK